MHNETFKKELTEIFGLNISKERKSEHVRDILYEKYIYDTGLFQDNINFFKEKKYIGDVTGTEVSIIRNNGSEKGDVFPVFSSYQSTGEMSISIEFYIPKKALNKAKNYSFDQLILDWVTHLNNLAWRIQNIQKSTCKKEYYILTTNIEVSSKPKK